MKSMGSKIGSKKRLTVAAAILALGFFGAGARNAQAQSQNDPGVARVSFLHGDVSMRRGDSGETSAVTLNTPLMAGDTIFTSDGARVELQLDYANILRLDGNAEANLATLYDNRIQVQIGQGLASYSVLQGSQADVEIDTPNVAVRPLREGRYRVEVFPSGDSQVTVREGQAEISTSEGSTRVNKGQLIVVQGTSQDAQYRMTGAYASDDFDAWSGDRDRIIFNAESARRTNRYYTGVGDLDAYGAWSDVPDYGPVWIPAVDVGWAPYRAGRWVWQPYWGWTWVSYEPWGWAPYHYGRWFLYNNRWAWWPGPITPIYRPVWAPAYVSFFGFGSGLSIGFSFGSIGWLPIGPCDYYNPWWGGYRERFTVVNIYNSVNIRTGIRPLHGGNRFSNLRDVHRDERLRNGVSHVRSESFGRGSEHPRGVRGDEFRNGRMMTGNLPVVPSRESLRVSDRPVNIPRNASNRNIPMNGASGGRGDGQGNDRQRFFTNRAPEGPRESFSDQSSRIQSAIRRNGNFRAIDAGAANSNGPGNSGRANSGPANNRPADNGGFRPQEQGSQGRGPQGRNDSPRGETRQSPQGTPQVAPQAGPRTQEGWNRFGRSEANPQQGQPQVNERDRFNGRGGQPSNRFEMQGRPDQQPQGERRMTDPGGNRSNQANPGWQRFDRSSRDSPDFYSAQRGEQRSNAQSNRPPLELRRPIVNQRSERQGNSEGNRPSVRTAQPRDSAPSAPASRNGPSVRSESRGNSGGNRGGVPAYSAPAPRSEPSVRGQSGGGNRVAPAPPQRSQPSGGNRVAPAPTPRSESSGGGNRGGGGERSGGGSRGNGGNDGGGNRGGGRGSR